MTYRRCQGCGHWHLKDGNECPECGTEPSRHNKWLRTASLNNHLFQQAETASKTPAEQKVSAYQAAKDYVSGAL